MAEKQFILSLDQGTTTSRSFIYDSDFNRTAFQQIEFKQYYPHSGWVEHDPETLWESQIQTARKAISEGQIDIKDIAGIGITNQRETTLVWNRDTGVPVYPAIVWQDRRTSAYCKQLKEHGESENVAQKTGLVIDPYFSATKIKWILDNVPQAKEQANQGKLAFGTVDTWLIWKLTKGVKHITDYSNASRTLVFNIRTLEWDQELLDLFGIPKSMMPTVVNNSGLLAETDPSIFGKSIPITGIAGDQQAALFGQLCTQPGMAKCTYGTGCFMMLNTGKDIIVSTHKMVATIAWKLGEETTYALEGSVFVGGALIQWLRDELMFIKDAVESEVLAEQAKDSGGVYFVPALTGLGAPYWDPDARGAIFGIKRSTTKAELTRAAIESIAFQVNDLMEAMSQDLVNPITQLRVDGGAASNSLLLQFQSDISTVHLLKPTQLETTSLGVAFFASMGAKQHTIASIKHKWTIAQEFKPKLDAKLVTAHLGNWKEAVSRSLGWASSTTEIGE